MPTCLGLRESVPVFLCLKAPEDLCRYALASEGSCWPISTLKGLCWPILTSEDPRRSFSASEDLRRSVPVCVGLKGSVLACLCLRGPVSASEGMPWPQRARAGLSVLESPCWPISTLKCPCRPVSTSEGLCRPVSASEGPVRQCPSSSVRSALRLRCRVTGPVGWGCQDIRQLVQTDSWFIALPVDGRRLSVGRECGGHWSDCRVSRFRYGALPLWPLILAGIAADFDVRDPS